MKNLPANARDMGCIGQKDPLEKGMATHSSILAWRIPWAEEPVGYSPWVHNESDMICRASRKISNGRHGAFLKAKK